MKGMFFCISLFLTALPVMAAIPLTEAEQQLIEEIKKKQVNIESSETNSRKIRALIYETSKKLEKLDDEDRELQEEMLLARKRVSEGLTSLKTKKQLIDSERKKIHKRFRLLAAWYRSGVGDLLFSSQSIKELDKRMYYLRKLLSHDSGRLNGFSNDMTDFDLRKQKLKREIKKMAEMRKRLRKNTKALSKLKQAQKRNLAKVFSKTNQNLQEIKQLRKKGFAVLARDLLQESFLELKGKMSLPLNGQIRLSYGAQLLERSRVSLFSNGISIVPRESLKVNSVAAGKVIFLGKLRNYGKTLIIDHGSRYYSVYSGLGRVFVDVDDKIDQNRNIAGLDSSVKNPELYFELRKFSEAINPMSWFQKEQINLATNPLESSAM